MVSNDRNIKGMNTIINKVISQINLGRDQIYILVDNIRKEYDGLKNELERIKKTVVELINEVDFLEKQDKVMRNRLAEVSSDFKKYDESDIKVAYEKASDIRVKLLIKKNEENILKEKRYSVELSLRRVIDNLKIGENMVSQVSIALGFLENDAIDNLKGFDRNSEMFLGMKILEAQEYERKRVARDIHDGPAQHMANVVMKADICKMIIQKDFEEGLKELEDLKKSVKLALKEVRGIIFDLRPMALDDLGLNQTIQETVNAIKEETGMEIMLKLKPINSDTDIEAIIQIAVYRILQEVFNNIKKHAKAKTVEVKLDYGTKYLMLIITDDGVGFDAEETFKMAKIKGSSYGLIGIHDRVLQLQGEIKIKSIIGQGTEYFIRLPINREVIKDEKRGN